ncbi:MAG: Shikimate kinase, partial [Pseudomonadota bacterium]
MGRGGLTPEETGFLDLLGLRVRRARAALGVSRRELAQRSGVSERYLAELESGRGNISILLLKRLATALGADLQDLLVPAVDLGRRGRLALLGLESATRRDCANALGELLGVPVFHLDVVATATIGG